MNYNMMYKNNQTIKFILPLITKLPASILLKDNFLGAFIGDTEKPQYDGKILLAYKIPLEREELKFELTMVQHPQYYTSYDYDEERIVVYVFNIPENSVESVENILDGKYSNISNKDKLEIIKFWEIYLERYKDNNPILKSILYSTNKELWFKPNLVEELFDIDNY